MNNALLYLGGLAIAVLAALFAVPTFVDWNGYRGVFEEQASKVLGRDVRVGGTVNVRLLPSPYVNFEKIRISDDAEGTGEPLFRAESFKMWLAVPPLLRGVFEANEIELKRPVLRLAADAQGSGNWRSLTFASGTLPFVPAEVMLEEVKIINGVLSLNGAQGTELARIEGINGDLNSETLAGPFKFKGTLKWEGGERDVRISTARPEPDGAVRFKSTVLVPANGNSYVVDGRISDIRERPRIEGELTAKVAFATSPGPGVSAPDNGTDAPGAEKGHRGGFDVRGKISGDATAVKLQDISMSLDRAGPPQIVMGEAGMSWLDKVLVNADLNSRWLDLDGTGGIGQVRPLEAARAFFEALTSLLPVEAETNVGLRLDQVNLGGEAVSGVRLAVVRAGGPLELKEFRANVPGAGRLALDGQLDVSVSPAKFDGNLALDGQSVLKFLSWALKDATVGEGRTDSPFSVSGRMQIADKALELRNAKAEIGGLPVRGEVRLEHDTRRRLRLALEGNKIDAGQLFSGSLGLKALSVFANASASAPDGPQTEAEALAAPAVSARLFDPSRSDMVLQVRAGQIVDGDRAIRDVTAMLFLEGDRLTAETLRFSTDDGLSVDISGDVGNARSKPAGLVRGTISARSAQSVKTLFRFFDLEKTGTLAETRLSELVPFDLAGTVSIGQRQPAAIDVVADGTVEGGRMVAKGRFDAGQGEWTAAPVEVSVAIDGARSSGALTAIVSGSAPGGAQPARVDRRLSAKVAGTPANGLVSAVSLYGEGLSLDYNGRIKLPAEGHGSATGSVRVSAADAREALRLAGLPFGAAIAGASVEGEIDVALDSSVLTLKPRNMMIGGSRVGGEVALTPSPGQPLKVSAKLEVDAATIPGLIAPLLAAAVERAPQPEALPPPPVPARRNQQRIEPAPQLASAALTPGLWPEQPFDLSVVDKAQGTIEATFKRLALDEGLTVSGATLNAVLEPGRIRVASLTGGALGGSLTSQLTIEKAPAGVGLVGSLKIATAPAAPQAGGEAGISSSLSVDFSGRALSPAALMTDLKGKGELALGDVTLTGMGPGPVAATAEAGLYGKGPSSGEALSQALKAALKQGQVRLGALKIPVQISDGSLRLERVSMETEEGRSTFETALELATMKVDSEWKIEAKVKPKPDDPAPAKPLLPAVSVIYAGKLKDFAVIEPTVDTAALERELTVRKMEHDVTELERLRKLDQAKAKEEQERQRALELERNKAAPAPSGDEGSSTAPSGGSTGADSGSPQSASVSDATSQEAAVGDGPLPDGAADPAAQAAPPRATAPVRRQKPAVVPKKSPPPSWKPFQFTPY